LLWVRHQRDGQINILSKKKQWRDTRNCAMFIASPLPNGLEFWLP
jgi:hypothetical protein